MFVREMYVIERLHSFPMAAMLVAQSKESNLNSFQLEHQHGGCDVMCKSSIRSVITMKTRSVVS